MAKCIASWKTLAIILFYVEPNANNFHLSMALSDIVPQICWRNAACNLAMSGGCDINMLALNFVLYTMIMISLIKKNLWLRHYKESLNLKLKTNIQFLPKGTLIEIGWAKV